MKQYFKYLAKTSILQTVILTILPTIIFLVSIANSVRNVSYYSVYGQEYQPPYIFTVAVVFGFILTVLIVVMRFSKFKSRQQLDLYYSLPISREKMIHANIILGILQTLIMFTIMYLSGIGVYAIMIEGPYKMGYLLLAFLFNALFLIIMFLTTMFLFLRANNIIDGIVFIAGWLVSLLLIGGFIYSNSSNAIMNQIIILTPFFSVDSLNTFFYGKATPGSYLMIKYDLRGVIYHTIIYAVLSGLAYYFTIRLSKRSKAELAGSVSESIFGYPTIVGIISAMFLALLFSPTYLGTNAIFIAITLVFAIVSFIVYRRGIRFKKQDYLLILMPIIIGIILGFAFNT